MSRKSIWWLVFLAGSFPFVMSLLLLLIAPRRLGIDPVEALLADSGQWALRFLLISLACSPLKRIGWKGILRFRRMLGLFAFFYATLHLFIYVVGWLQWNWHAFLEDLTKRPFIYIGMVTWLMLFFLAITSPKKVVRLLKKNWSRLHKIVYLSAVLAWIHFWMQTRASAAEPLIYLLFIALVLGERLFRKHQKQLAVRYKR